MFVLKKDYVELQKKLEVMQRLWTEEKAEASRYRGLIEGKDVVIDTLKDKIKSLKDEKSDLLNDLMVSSGIRMSKQQQLLMAKQLQNDAGENFNLGSQAKEWERSLMEQHLKKSPEQLSKEAIELMEELENEWKNENKMSEVV